MLIEPSAFSSSLSHYLMEGVTAFVYGQPRTANPHDDGEDNEQRIWAAGEWYIGWDAANARCKRASDGARAELSTLS